MTQKATVLVVQCIYLVVSLLYYKCSLLLHIDYVWARIPYKIGTSHAPIPVLPSRHSSLSSQSEKEVHVNVWVPLHKS